MRTRTNLTTLLGMALFFLVFQCTIASGGTLYVDVKVSGADVKIEVDPAKLRGKADVRQVYGSYKKLNMHCGWKPQISLRESILHSK